MRSTVPAPTRAPLVPEASVLKKPVFEFAAVRVLDRNKVSPVATLMVSKLVRLPVALIVAFVPVPLTVTLGEPVATPPVAPGAVREIAPPLRV